MFDIASIAALAPAKVESIVMDEDSRSMELAVNEENLAPVVEEKTLDKTKTTEDKQDAPKVETKKEEIKKDTLEEKK